MLHSESVFQTLTQNGKLKLTRACLDNFLLNIKKDENGNSITLTPPETDKDTYDSHRQRKTERGESFS